MIEKVVEVIGKADLIEDLVEFKRNLKEQILEQLGGMADVSGLPETPDDKLEYMLRLGKCSGDKNEDCESVHSDFNVTFTDIVRGSSNSGVVSIGKPKDITEGKVEVSYKGRDILVSNDIDELNTILSSLNARLGILEGLELKELTEEFMTL